MLSRRLRSQPVDGRIAQLVEQLTLNQRVLGSSPSAPTIEIKLNQSDIPIWGPGNRVSEKVYAAANSIPLTSGDFPASSRADRIAKSIAARAHFEHRGAILLSVGICSARGDEMRAEIGPGAGELPRLQAGVEVDREGWIALERIHVVAVASRRG